MKPIALLPGCRYRFATILCAVSISTLVHAGPGAHGPNGEHLDGAAAGSAQGGASPRVEAKSETFELVGRLEDGVFAIFIDRFATNEPVLSANVEVEAGNTRAKAAFRAAQGDYVVTDPAMLKLLSGPARQAMVFTVAAGADTDLLDGALVPASGAGGQDAGQGHVSAPSWRYAAVAVALAIAIAAFLIWRRRSGRTRPSPWGAGK